MTLLHGRLLAFLVDVVCLLAFALGGKSAHEHSDSDVVVLAIVWPYVVACLLAHALLGWRGRRPAAPWPEGGVVLATTYVVGMVLRAISGRGIAPGFLVVAVVFLAITMLGWRSAALLVSRRARRG